jgi:hypothetical protein
MKVTYGRITLKSAKPSLDGKQDTARYFEAAKGFSITREGDVVEIVNTRTGEGLELSFQGEVSFGQRADQIRIGLPAPTKPETPRAKGAA